MCLTRDAAGQATGEAVLRKEHCPSTLGSGMKAVEINPDPLPGITTWTSFRNSHEVNLQQVVFGKHTPGTDSAFSGCDRYRLGPSSFETIIQVFKQE